MVTLTDAQRLAVQTHDRNVIVIASAGSGKTRVLVERYLSLLEANPNWPLNALVAITFTKKAAQEMRDRVRQRLQERLSKSRGSAEARRWSELLASMDSVRIDTIHGLCGAILRANAAYAGVDPGFQVLDEVDARILLDSVMDRVFQALVDEGDASTALFAEYDADRIRVALAAHVNRAAAELPDELYESWGTQWREDAVVHLQRLLDHPDFPDPARWQPPGGGPSVADKLLDVWNECRDYLHILYESDTLAHRLDALYTLRDCIKLNVGSVPAWGGKDVLDEVKRSLRVVRDFAEITLAAIGEPPGDADHHATHCLALWRPLLRRVQDAYSAAKSRFSVMDFDDLERRTRKLLLDDPQVRERYRGAEFKHVLVDEFQDTNTAQWDIIQALAPPDGLFIVGDAKQSIYSFRGADVSVFGAVRQKIAATDGAEIALACSFRSHRPLVDCYNHLFSRLFVRGDDSRIHPYEIELGEPLVAERTEPPAALPALELLLVNSGHPALDRHNGKADQCRRWEACEIALRLHQMVEIERRPVYDKHHREVRPMRYDDVALLFQSTTSITIYEETFKAFNVGDAEGIPFVTVAGRGYYNRQEVWDLLNLLQALYNPADDLAIASVLRSPLFNLSDDALLALRINRDVDGLWAGLAAPIYVPDDEQQRVAFARDCLYQLHNFAGRVIISELLREALVRTGYLATLSGLPDGARRRGNVEKLLEKAYASGKVTLGAFSLYLSDLSEREVREGEALLDTTGAVTLMSVHASKGLEYPVVVLVDAAWHGGYQSEPLLINDPVYGLACKVYDSQADKLVESYSYRQASRLRRLRDNAERKRLLYVAATRAQDYLLVTGQVRQNQNGQWRVQGWLGALWDALELHDLQPQEEMIRDYPWGKAMLRFPTQPPSSESFRMGERSAKTLWDSAAVQNEQPLQPERQPETPLLLCPVAIPGTTSARHLTATQIADLGSEESFHKQRFRQEVIYNAPASIPTVSQGPKPYSARQLGNIVHKALRWQRFPGDSANIEAILDTYAWEEGIFDSDVRRQAVKAALNLLERTRQSAVYRWMSEAEEVYRELSFLYQTAPGDHIVHGMIDVLFKTRQGQWVMVDYKTSYVRDGDSNLQALVEHARGYHLQMAVYAQAVTEQLGGQIVPEVYIHYVRYANVVPVHEQERRQALAGLESRIGILIG